MTTTTKNLILTTIAAIALSSSVAQAGWFSKSKMDKSAPPTGWSDLRFAQMTPGNCQNKAYAYCQRLVRRGFEAKVLVVELHHNGQYHAVVQTVDKKGRDIYVDATSGDVWFAENYADGTVISDHAYALKSADSKTQG